MLTTNKEFAFKYNYLSEPFQKAFEFLKRDDLDKLEPGKYPIDGEQVVAYIQHYATNPSDQLKFETHDCYFDIQFMITGQEEFGYTKRSELTVLKPYDKAADITFYQPPKVCGSVILGPGDFAIAPPEDAHRPGGMVGRINEVKKAVIKIKC